MADMCANHPVKKAVNKCKKCGKLLCRDCIIQKENGIFCSIECYQEAKEFTNKVMDVAPKTKKSLIPKLIILIIILAAAVWGLKTFLGIDILKMIRG